MLGLPLNAFTPCGFLTPLDPLRFERACVIGRLLHRLVPWFLSVLACRFLGFLHLLSSYHVKMSSEYSYGFHIGPASAFSSASRRGTQAFSCVARTSSWVVAGTSSWQVADIS